MDSERAEFVLEAMEAGYTFGYAGKEGTMTVKHDDGRYSFYEAGDPNPEPDSFATTDRTEFLRFLENRSHSGFERSIEVASCSLAFKDLAVGRLPEARTKLERAIRWGAGHAAAGLALVAAITGEVEEARRHLVAFDDHVGRAGSRYQPFGPLAVFLDQLLDGLYELPRYQQMRDVCTRLLSAAERADVYYARGFAHEQLGALDDAVADLERCVDGELTSTVRVLAWLRLGWSLLELGKAEEALSAAGSGLELRARDPQLLQLREDCERALAGG